MKTFLKIFFWLVATIALNGAWLPYALGVQSTPVVLLGILSTVIIDAYLVTLAGRFIKQLFKEEEPSA